MKMMLVASAVLMTLNACVTQQQSSGPQNKSEAVPLLSCQDAVWSGLTPGPGYTSVLGIVAFPIGRTLEARTLGADDYPPAGWTWAKSGLMIRRGAQFDLVVPDEWRGRLMFGWNWPRPGHPNQMSTHLRIPGCRPEQALTKTTNPIHARDLWLGYAGGYIVQEPACVAVVVRSGKIEQTVHIGIGTPCPGEPAPN